jgi:hypothetical protein
MRHPSRREGIAEQQIAPVTTPQNPDAGGLPDFDPAVLIDVDVRDDLRAGRHPLPRLLAHADALPEGGVLHVRAPFRPLPLVHVLAQRGFAHHSEAFADDDWSSWFWRSDSPLVQSAAASEPVTAAPPGTIDLRQLPPPEPLVAILAQVTRTDAPFDVLLAFDPVILGPLLARQGWQVTLIDRVGDGVRLRLSPTDAEQ